MVNKAETDVYLELSCFFDDTAAVDNLISGSSACSKTSLNIWKFMVHISLKPVVFYKCQVDQVCSPLLYFYWIFALVLYQLKKKC